MDWSVTTLGRHRPHTRAMSEPDYDQCAEDHQSLLVVVKQIGSYVGLRSLATALAVTHCPLYRSTNKSEAIQ